MLMTIFGEKNNSEGIVSNIDLRICYPLCVLTP